MLQIEYAFMNGAEKGSSCDPEKQREIILSAIGDISKASVMVNPLIKYDDIDMTAVRISIGERNENDARLSILGDWKTSELEENANLDDAPNYAID